MLSRKQAGTESGQRPLFPLTLAGVIYTVGETRLLDIAHLALGTGSRTVIMGPNGAGKSLLLRLVHGLIQPMRGSILWNGARVDQVRARQGFVAQRPVLLRRSAAANIHFALGGTVRPQEKASRVAEALSTARLEHRADTPARMLSGGEQQRLAIARALARRPDVLLLDEPTASLDPASIHAVETMIGGAARSGVRIILVTHDIGQAKRLADEVIFLDRGRLAEQTQAADFFAKPNSEAARAYLDGRLFLEQQTS